MNLMTLPLRILIVDDDEDDFLITSEYIHSLPENNFKIDWCFRYNDALQHIENRAYDLYMIDYRMGTKTGLDLLKAAMQMDCEEPIILLTGKGNPEVDREAMETGATDYLIKSELNTEKLERALRYALERSSSLKALKANERKYHNIFERSRDAIFITNEYFYFKEVNDTTCSLLGCSNAELYNYQLTDFIADAEKKNMLVDVLSSKEKIYDFEIEIISKNDDKWSCILAATIEKEINGKKYIQGIMHNISELKKAEKINLQAEKLAASARLVRTLAHEVRNPLNNIVLSAEQLSRDDDESPDLYLDIIKRNSKRISDLISELLESSRLGEINMEQTSIREIMDETLATAHDRLLLKHIRLKRTYPRKVYPIMADKEKLQLAFLNIIINAVEAMEEQKGILTVHIYATEKKVTVDISDNGCGISEENIARLFEPYFTSKRNGIGLGLPAVLAILQSHKATIEVTSALKKGTRFSIAFDKA